MQRFSGCLRKVVLYENRQTGALPRRGPNPSTLGEIIYCMCTISKLHTHIVPYCHQKFCYTLSSIVHTVNRDHIMCLVVRVAYKRLKKMENKKTGELLIVGSWLGKFWCLWEAFA